MIASQPYAHRYKEVAVKTANPLQLVVMLYDGAIQSLQEAQEHLQRKNIAQRARALNKCTAILSELQASLNFKEGGEIAPSLDRLYNYMKGQVFKANIEQRPEPLAEVVTLLGNLRNAWRELAAQTQIASTPKSTVTSADSGLSNSHSPASTSMSNVNLCG